MTTTDLKPVELRNRGYDALLRELGPVGFIRFMQQFEPGSGDYTRDREQWLGGLTLDQVFETIMKQRACDEAGARK